MMFINLLLLHFNVGHVVTTVGGPENGSTVETSLGLVLPRRMQQALPRVGSVDFQDFDLDLGEVSGTVTWTPPSDVSEVSGYEVYLTDATWNRQSHTHLGSVPVGTHVLLVPENTMLSGPRGELSHVFVFTRSILGTSPQGTGVALCDVRWQDRLFLANAEQTTVKWGIREASFFSLPDCSGTAMRWAQVASTDNEVLHAAELAFDGDAHSAWISNCSGSCDAGALSLGVIGVCRPEEARCLRLRQCNPGSPSMDCPMAAGRLGSVTLLVQGREVYTWKVLKELQSGRDDILSEEVLIITGRRRRAGVAVFSEDPRPEQYTNPAFSSR